MFSYPNPCDSCTISECRKGNGCNKWQMRFRTIWKQFNSYPKRKAMREKKVRHTYVYEHPDILRKYIQDGPCKGCKAERTCDTPCSAYYAWWDARMAVARHKIGVDHD